MGRKLLKVICCYLCGDKFRGIYNVGFLNFFIIFLFDDILFFVYVGVIGWWLLYVGLKIFELFICIEKKFLLIGF